MEGLLWALVYAGLFFVMMRFGCGSHIMHGRGRAGHGSTTGQGVASMTDPVCGMQVSTSESYSRNYRGRVLHFCSRSCLDQFEADPARYAGESKTQMPA